MDPVKTESAANEFREYAYGVSHDLSAPVRAMVEFSRLLTTEHAASLNDEGREYLSLIIESGAKLQAMMDGLLQYSRLNTEARPFRDVSAGEALQRCRSAMSERIAASGAELQVAELPVVQADSEQLTQLFSALIDNAISFQPPGRKPVIQISAEQVDGYWRFAVADNGIGIAPRFHEKIFKLFQRLHADEEYPGVGIGLFLAQKIVHRHGGAIWCEPVAGQGTCFYFTLPLSQES